MPLRLDQEAQSWGGQEGFDELPCQTHGPWLAEHPLVGADPHELIENRPSGIPGLQAQLPCLDELTTAGMFRAALLRCIDEDVGVNQERQRCSMTLYRASRSAMSTSAPPPSNEGRDGSSPVASGPGSRRSRSADSTRFEIVSPRRAASSRSRTMTLSSMISVVFIWKTIQGGNLFVKLGERQGGSRAAGDESDQRPLLTPTGGWSGIEGRGESNSALSTAARRTPAWRRRRLTSGAFW